MLAWTYQDLKRDPFQLDAGGQAPQRPRRMNQKDAELVCKEGEKEIQRMLDAGLYLSST